MEAIGRNGRRIVSILNFNHVSFVTLMLTRRRNTSAFSFARITPYKSVFRITLIIMAKQTQVTASSYILVIFPWNSLSKWIGQATGHHGRKNRKYLLKIQTSFLVYTYIQNSKKGITHKLFLKNTQSANTISISII